jgi:hypothetical protein
MATKTKTSSDFVAPSQHIDTDGSLTAEHRSHLGQDGLPSESSKISPNVETNTEKKDTFEKGPRFWAIIATLCVIGLLSALENTVVTTSLPYIVGELELGENYVWITNVFFLTS